MTRRSPGFPGYRWGASGVGWGTGPEFGDRALGGGRPHGGNRRARPPPTDPRGREEIGDREPPTELSPAELGWLLANAREHAASPELRSAAGFARGGPTSPCTGRRSGVGVGPHPGGVRRRPALRTHAGAALRQLTLAADFMARRLDPLRSSRRAPPVPRHLGGRRPAARGVRAVRRADDRPALGRAVRDPRRPPGSAPAIRDWERLLSRVALETSVTSGLEYSFPCRGGGQVGRAPPQWTDGDHPRRSGALGHRDADLRGCPAGPYTTDPGAAPMLVRHLEVPEVRESAAWMLLYILTTFARNGRLPARLLIRAGTRALQLLREDDRSVRTHRTGRSPARRHRPTTRDRIVRRPAVAVSLPHRPHRRGGQGAERG